MGCLAAVVTRQDGLLPAQKAVAVRAAAAVVVAVIAFAVFGGVRNW